MGAVVFPCCAFLSVFTGKPASPLCYAGEPLIRLAVKEREYIWLFPERERERAKRSGHGVGTSERPGAMFVSGGVR